MSADFWSEKENFITLKSADKLRKLGLTKIQDDKVLEIIGIERGSIKEMCRSVRDTEKNKELGEIIGEITLMVSHIQNKTSKGDLANIQKQLQDLRIKIAKKLEVK